MKKNPGRKERRRTFFWNRRHDRYYKQRLNEIKQREVNENGKSDVK